MEALVWQKGISGRKHSCRRQPRQQVSGQMRKTPRSHWLWVRRRGTHCVGGWVVPGMRRQLWGHFSCVSHMVSPQRYEF